MATLEERVAHLEGQVSEHSHALAGIRDAIHQLGQRMDARFDAVDRRFEAVDRRFETIDRRFETIDQRFETIDRRFETVDRKLMWVVGFQVTTLVAIVAALLARA